MEVKEAGKKSRVFSLIAFCFAAAAFVLELIPAVKAFSDSNELKAKILNCTSAVLDVAAFMLFAAFLLFVFSGKAKKTLLPISFGMYALETVVSYTALIAIYKGRIPVTRVILPMVTVVLFVITIAFFVKERKEAKWIGIAAGAVMIPDRVRALLLTKNIRNLDFLLFGAAIVVFFAFLYRGVKKEEPVKVPEQTSALKLQTLNEQYRLGALTEEEYKARRAEIIAKL